METVRVLQLGAEDFSKSIQISDCVEWCYEPDFSELPEKDFDVVILDRGVSTEEFDFLVRFMRAYTLFITEKISVKKGDKTYQLFIRKRGKRVSPEELKKLLTEDLPDYFPGSYGEKCHPRDLSIAQGFAGKVSWRGYEGVDLEGDYGNALTQIAFWRYNPPLFENQAIEFWLEYTKDGTLEIALEITLLQFLHTSEPIVQEAHVFTEDDLKSIVYVENQSENRRYISISLRAMGEGHLTITALHSRYSRRGKGHFIPGGRRIVTSEREEIFFYFDPGNLKPPLNVYFSGYKTQEGFEGYYMMRRMDHPFLLIAEARFEGGAFYIGTEEYEKNIEQIIRKCMKVLGFENSEVILSGLSMGSFGALYYGCRIRPNTILLGKPLASIGDIAANEKLKSPDSSHSWLDVLHKACGSLGKEAVEHLNKRFWDKFDRTNWSETRFAVAYMIEDDLDRNAYENLQSHLKDAGVRIYGKGLHGRHNDNTPGIVNWFVSQYREIIRIDFDEKNRTDGGYHGG